MFGASCTVETEFTLELKPNLFVEFRAVGTVFRGDDGELEVGQDFIVEILDVYNRLGEKLGLSFKRTSEVLDFEDTVNNEAYEKLLDAGKEVFSEGAA